MEGYSVREVFEALNEGERCHMANLLYKEGYVALKATQAIAEANLGPALMDRGVSYDTLTD